MKRITESQRVKIVRLFQSGTSMSIIALSWETSVEKIEDIIRAALRQAGVQP